MRRRRRRRRRRGESWSNKQQVYYCLQNQVRSLGLFCSLIGLFCSLIGLFCSFVGVVCSMIQKSIRVRFYSPCKRITARPGLTQGFWVPLRASGGEWLAAAAAVKVSFVFVVWKEPCKWGCWKNCSMAAPSAWLVWFLGLFSDRFDRSDRWTVGYFYFPRQRSSFRAGCFFWLLKISEMVVCVSLFYVIDTGSTEPRRQ